MSYPALEFPIAGEKLISGRQQHYRKVLKFRAPAIIMGCSASTASAPDLTSRQLQLKYGLASFDPEGWLAVLKETKWKVRYIRVTTTGTWQELNTPGGVILR